MTLDIVKTVDSEAPVEVNRASIGFSMLQRIAAEPMTTFVPSASAALNKFTDTGPSGTGREFTNAVTRAPSLTNA